MNIYLYGLDFAARGTLLGVPEDGLPSVAVAVVKTEPAVRAQSISANTVCFGERAPVPSFYWS
jgi:hypothetical protein